jgi:hypothetical protein
MMPTGYAPGLVVGRPLRDRSLQVRAMCHALKAHETNLDALIAAEHASLATLVQTNTSYVGCAQKHLAVPSATHSRWALLTDTCGCPRTTCARSSLSVISTAGRSPPPATRSARTETNVPLDVIRLVPLSLFFMCAPTRAYSLTREHIHRSIYTFMPPPLSPSTTHDAYT